jgi:hypothetical protein
MDKLTARQIKLFNIPVEQLQAHSVTYQSLEDWESAEKERVTEYLVYRYIVALGASSDLDMKRIDEDSIVAKHFDLSVWELLPYSFR